MIQKLYNVLSFHKVELLLLSMLDLLAKGYVYYSISSLQQSAWDQVIYHCLVWRWSLHWFERDRICHVCARVLYDTCIYVFICNWSNIKPFLFWILFHQEEKQTKIKELTAELRRTNQRCEVYRANLLSVLRDMEEQKLKLSVKVQNARLSLKD